MENLIKTTNKFGTIEYRLNGELHRTDGPAIENEDGSKQWYKNGILYKEIFRTIIQGVGIKFIEKTIDKHRTIEYKLNGKLHYENGSAVRFANGDEKWYMNGKLHRTDGPAIVFANGEKQWWKEGVQYFIQTKNSK